MDTDLTINQMRDDVANLIHEEPREIGLDDNLIDLGLDSLHAMNLATKWSEQGVELNFPDLAERPTLNAWWKLVQLHKSGVPNE